MSMTKYDRDLGAETTIVPTADFDGPVKRRRITDLLFAFILLCTWGGCIYLGYWAMQNGDPYRLISPSDYKGRICGVDEDENGNTLPIKWHIVDPLLNGICIEKCPQKNIFSPSNRTEMICKEDNDILKMEGCANNGTITENIDLLVVCGACMYQLDTFSSLDHCLPDTLTPVLNQIKKAAEAVGIDPLKNNTVVNEYLPLFERFARDMYTAKEVIFGIGFGGAAFLGFMFLFLLRFPYLVSFTVWTSSIFVPGLIGVGGYFFFTRAQEYEMINEQQPTEIHSESKIFATRIISYVLWGLAGFLVFVLIFMRKRIKLAVAITKVAASAVIGVPYTIFYPLLQLFGYALLYFPWATFIIYLASIGEPVTKTADLFGVFKISYTVFQYSDFVFYTFWFMLFVLFWTSEFIVAIGQITLSICFSKWYFTVDKDSRVNVSVLCTTCTAFCKHFGTAAFGALIVAIIQWVRAVIMWFQRKLKQYGMDNVIVKAVACCCQCCLCCLERFMKFISKNAYVHTAIFGYSFCKAAQESFFLILRNAARTTAVGLVSELSMIFCKLFVMAGVSVGSYAALHKLHGDEISSITAITAFITIISWFIADIFVEVFGIAVVTILQCFLADEEMFPEGSYYVPEELDDFLDQLDIYEQENQGKR